MSGDTQIKQFIRTQPQIYLALSRDFKETCLLYGVINILPMTLLEQTRRDRKASCLRGQEGNVRKAVENTVKVR